MGIIREQDWRVKSVVEVPIPPQEGVLFNLGFVFYSETQTEIKKIQTEEDFEEYFKNSEEKCWVSWMGKSFFAIPYKEEQEILPKIQELGTQCFILLFSMQATLAMEHQQLDWWGIKMYQNTSQKPWEDKIATDLCLQERTGVFCDPEKEGKAFHALMSILEQGYPYLSNIKNQRTVFSSCFNTLEHRDALISTGFSWYKDTQQGVTIWDTFVGGYQFKAIMGLYIADDEVKTIYSQFIDSGKGISMTTIGDVEVSVGQKLSQLVENRIIASFKIHKTPVQSDANLVKGIIKLGEKECGLVNEFNLISYVIKGV